MSRSAARLFWVRSSEFISVDSVISSSSAEPSRPEASRASRTAVSSPSVENWTGEMLTAMRSRGLPSRRRLARSAQA